MTENENTVAERITFSPLGRLLGVEVVSAERDLVELRLPFRTEVTTAGVEQLKQRLPGLVVVY